MRVDVWSTGKGYLGQGDYNEDVDASWGGRSFKTPKIVLDTGGVVYGCTCWWHGIDLEEMDEWRKTRQDS